MFYVLTLMSSQTINKVSSHTSQSLAYWRKQLRKTMDTKNKEEGKYQESILLTQDTISGSDKTQENITHNRAKRSALSQHVTTRLQGTDTTV